MTHSIAVEGRTLATFTDYNVAILCLPAIARAAGKPVRMFVSEKAVRTVPIPPAVMVIPVRLPNGEEDAFVCRP